MPARDLEHPIFLISFTQYPHNGKTVVLLAINHDVNKVNVRNNL